MERRVYVTTSIPYVNAAPHVGFALELVQADVIARFHRLTGREVRFQTGTDENAAKNVLAARQQGLTTRELVDRNSGRFRDLLPVLNVSADNFIRTTEESHRRGVHALWESLNPDDVYRKAYHGLYCTGCEDFYLPQDLEDGRCPEHRTAPAEVAEENYFFRLSAYQRRLEDLLSSSAVQVVPETRRNEVLSFVRRGLHDISISRSADRTGGWGIRVPGDDSQVIYVWIDALVNYISGLGFGSGDDWRQWWGNGAETLHVIGKNVWKFHAVYWPALLLSARLPLPDRIVVHGFLTADGRKIGKSLGNAVDPFGCVQAFGADAVRYYLLRAVPPFDDGDFSERRLRQIYDTDLANGLGNLVGRLTTLCERAKLARHESDTTPEAPEGYLGALESYELDKAAGALWRIVAALNRQIEAARPWELLKARDRGPLRRHLHLWLGELHRAAHWLGPLLPDASTKVLAAIRGPRVARGTPLFPRLRV